MYIRFNRTKIPAQSWTLVLQAIFKYLQYVITSSPLLGWYDSDKSIFLKTHWSATGMGYMLLYSVDNSLSNNAITKLRTTGECDFDISTKTGPWLRPILFNSITCTDTENHYHGFVGDISCGWWAIAKEKQSLWGTHFYWLCNMKTTYNILHYTGPIHVLHRWCQDLLAYSFSFIHRSYDMMVDVDYLSRMHERLVKSHTVLSNAWSLADREARPCAYKCAMLDMLLRKDKYSTKSLTTSISTHILNNISLPPPYKKLKSHSSISPIPRCSSPIQTHVLSPSDSNTSNWRLDVNDNISYCAEF